MIADERLPGEDSLSPMRMLTRPPLDAFKRLEVGRAWPRNLDRFFLTILFCNSSARRIYAGSSGLIAETARDILADMIPDLKRLYLQREIFVSVSDAELDRLAGELADEMMKRPSFRTEVFAAFRGIREDVAKEYAYDEHLAAYVEMESAIATLNRWTDYVELKAKLGFVREYFFVHRFLVCCLRLYDAVFGTSNLKPRRG
jgi:hypothetical protein